MEVSGAADARVCGYKDDTTIAALGLAPLDLEWRGLHLRVRQRDTGGRGWWGKAERGGWREDGEGRRRGWRRG